MKYTFLISLFLLATVDVFAQQCQNEDFEDGNTNGWTGYTGSISSIGVPVIKTFGFVAGRHTIMSGLGGDEIAAACNITIPKVESSGLYSLRLGNSLVGAQAERITKTFVVESGKEFFMYKYAVVLEDPSHEQFAQPRFEVRVFDKNGKLASCGVFKVRAGPNAANDGFQLCTSGFRKFWVKDWTVSGADLSAFVGEQVTIEFLTTDCAYGGHAGYAYVEASCKKLDIDLDGFCPTGSGFGNFKASVSEGFKSYKWSNGSSGNSTTFSGLAYGDVISVEVTTFTGCSSKFSRKLEPPLPVSINPLPDMQACKGEPFSLTATGTNVGFFVWDYNNTKASTLLITPANDVVLSYEAYDRNGCPTGIKDDVQLTVNGFDVAIQKTDVTCGQLQDGTISLTPQNGNAPFSYVWKDDPALNSNARVDLRPGKYEVKVSENQGCSRELIIEVKPATLLNLVPKTVDSQCARNNGKAEVNASGGIQPYTYQWQNYPTETDEKLENVPAGTYTVVVRDQGGNGCPVPLNIEVKQPEIFLTMEVTHPRCVVNDGELNVLAQGGSGVFPPATAFVWSNGANTQTISHLTQGNYTVTVTDTYGCTKSLTEVLNPPPSPLVATGNVVKDALCAFDDGAATIGVQGGAPPSHYVWSSGYSGAAASLTNVAVGSYQIDVMDANGCSVATTVVIGPPPPLMQLSVTSTDALCNLNDGTAQAKVVGGKAPYQFTWTPSAGSTASVINLAVGMHGVTVKDSNGCAVTYGTINIGAPLTTMSVDLTATGESYQLRNGTASVDVQGGYPPYRYQWTPLVGDKAVFLGLPAGSYSVFVTDAKGCTISGTVSVNPIPPIDIPNAFTPNQDGINDYWMIGNIAEYPRAKVQVFNRWGNELFFSNGYVNPWDGTVQGKIFPVDTYYYIIDLQIGIKPFVGYVDIIR